VEHAHAPGTCPKCWAALETPLFCETCQHLLEPSQAVSPFRALGVETSYDLNAMALRKRLLALSRRLHPDFHANADARTRDLAERNSAELNAAFEILSDDVRRADWLVRSLAGPSDEEERSMPPEFLAEVLEWNETIEAARGGADDPAQRAALAVLEKTLADERARLMDAVARELSPLPAARSESLRVVRRHLNAVRYIDRARRELAELALRRPTPAPR
jgi:molecular chaperone HscB